ncbi:amino acid deaminase [Granulicella mallensis]|uniref:D-serine dehydratase n=1 Tax=Granulicella mallensis TaxID=940614 RepID=A0A7W8EC72_9BACT|nr:amino acid deaminase [Granulicella mallensis]MBB5066349.1 D-serine dehydratase [Granulicella mallensis]
MNDKQATHTVAFPAMTSLNKGLGHLGRPVASGEIASLGWNLLAEDLSLPSAVLYEDRLLHNLNWMQEFIAAYGVKLAPHGKTTMAPQLFRLQLQAGAWGITLATAHQTLVAYEHGVRRILMANQLVGKENMAIISRLLQDQSFDYYCLVDSAAQVDQLGAFFSQTGQRLQVLLELGAMGGRTGVRDEAQLQTVLEALARWSASIALCGVEMYEGVLAEEEAIRAFLHRAVAVTRTLAEEKRFERAPALLSGAGSAWYDVVAEVFSAAGFGDNVEIVLRPGCYLTHDIGAYRDAQTQILERNPIARRMRSGLLPALHVWAYVQSVPEPEKAIIAMGKRDAAFDAGLPAPALHFRPGGAVPKSAPAHWTLTKMMDQHAYLQIAERDDLRVGDMIGFDISHPCLTFDKWRSLLVLNAEYQVVDAVQTFF